jgi:hypothetical protein
MQCTACVLSSRKANQLGPALTQSVWLWVWLEFQRASAYLHSTIDLRRLDSTHKVRELFSFYHTTEGLVGDAGSNLEKIFLGHLNVNFPKSYATYTGRHMQLSYTVFTI